MRLLGGHERKRTELGAVLFYMQRSFTLSINASQYMPIYGQYYITPEMGACCKSTMNLNRSRAVQAARSPHTTMFHAFKPTQQLFQTYTSTGSVRGCDDKLLRRDILISSLYILIICLRALSMGTILSRIASASA